jgi:flagellum-specific peptidoglycan hydrolase FlgJ
MYTKILSIKLWDYTVILLFLMMVFLIGTFFPNDHIKDKIRQSTIDEIRKIGFFEPKVDNTSSDKFIASMQKCIAYHNFNLQKNEQVPTVLIIAQAIVESDYGTSRFAREGNNLFGIRVWGTTNGMLPLLQDPSIKWRVKIYKSKCASVKSYIDTLNQNHHYQEFRQMRNRTKDPIKLAQTLENYSTSQSYRITIIEMINKIKNKI